MRRYVMRNEKIYKLTLTALMAALSYVVFTFLQIKIPLPGGDATSFHLGNAVCWGPFYWEAFMAESAVP